MDRRVTPPGWVTSPTWGPPPPCKQALRILIYRTWAIVLFMGNETKRMQTRRISGCLISQSAQKLHEPLVCVKENLSKILLVKKT